MGSGGGEAGEADEQRRVIQEKNSSKLPIARDAMPKSHKACSAFSYSHSSKTWLRGYCQTVLVIGMRGLLVLRHEVEMDVCATGGEEDTRQVSRSVAQERLAALAGRSRSDRGPPTMTNRLL